MATFSPVNTALAPDMQGRNGEETNPLTPRPSTAPSSQMQNMNRDDATTPTRANFGSLANQRPLPDMPEGSPFPSTLPRTPSEDAPSQGLNRGNSQYSAKSRGSDDVEMGDSDGEEGSDDESVNADGTRSSKKKGKSQRFYCTDYPPCTLSFTRSEHLARHIRKHTGERPFQCHCSRRFSRLDNLRQHAQTVHQNEEIPTDSLAATGTRFQRQVRTDRVRPPGSRSRASTAGSQTQPRGHHRNSLSASSVSSMGSLYGQRELDMRRRPPPLVMASPQQRYSQEYGRPDSPGGYQYRTQSPGFSTPTSATYSNGANSPHWGSGMQSPMSSHSRTTSLYGHRTPGRRLSVPSAGVGNPFQSPSGSSFGPPVLGQMNASNMGAFSNSNSMISSPTTSTNGSTWSRRESVSSAADEAWRRRTWHPDSHTSFTSRLQQVTTPNYYSTGPPPQPPIVPSNAPPLEPVRLPGIASFDPLPRPATPVRRQPSPMMLDTPSQPVEYQERPTSQHWDQGINRNMNRLDLAQGPPPDATSSWANEANRAIQAQGEQVRAQPAVRFEESVYSGRPQTSSGAYHQHHVSAPPVTPKESKRMAWYHGPVSVQTSQPIQPQPVQRTSPADSSSSEGGIPGTPNNPGMHEYHPSIVHSNGWVENRNGQPQPDPRTPQSNGYNQFPSQNPDGAYTYTPAAPQNQQRQQQIPKTTDSNMLRLEALVAVATNEEHVAAAAY